jgi:hypothetical protein
MPIHDWTRVEAGTFHAFHQLWIASLCNRLNAGCLPKGFFAMPEQRVSGPELDVLALETRGRKKARGKTNGGTAVIDTPPKTRIVESTQSELYAKKADRIVIQHARGRIVAFVEIISPGNKGSRQALRAFVEKTVQLLDQGIHLLVVDLFPPSKRDPQGIHRAIWEEIHDTSFRLPSGKPLTLAAYASGWLTTAYVEPVAVGDAMPDMPLFLEREKHVLTPLEATYLATWEALPEEIQELLE